MANARIAAAKAVESVCDQGRSLDSALAQFEPDAEQRGFFRELVYGSLRWGLWYGQHVDTQLKKPFKSKDRLLRHYLVCALYEIDAMHTPDHAVVNEAVKATRALKRQWASGLTNAILRAYLRTPLGFPDDSADAFPSWLRQRIEKDWPEHSQPIFAALQTKPPMTLRVNTQQGDREQALHELKQAEIGANACIDSHIGVQLTAAVAVEQIPGFDQGRFSVQDESAQLTVNALTLKAHQTVLDACAAPGGKTGQFLERESTLTVSALDLPHRLKGLHENKQRLQQCFNIIEGDATQPNDWWDGVAFDHILLDVPCSGTGVINRHPDIKLRRSPQQLTDFVRLQQDILTALWPLLKTGGSFMYATCSIMPEENSGQMQWFFERHPDASEQVLPNNYGISQLYGKQRLPGVTHGDGFYFCHVVKV